MRVKSLDGLRGVAVALVVLHHYFKLAWGWIGVDIFFGLSGYLITSILLVEVKEAHFWKIFYIRRATRILPAFLLFLVLVGAAGLVHWRVVSPYLLLLIANVGIVRKPVEFAELTILWSLSVEEHFYLVWPLLVRRFTRKNLVAILATLILLEPVLRFFIFKPASFTTTYFLTPFRLDGLAMGSLLAIAIHTHPVFLKKWSSYLVLPTLCILGTSLWRQPAGITAFWNIGGFTLLAFFVTCILAYLITRPQSWLASVLSVWPLTALGRISYGVYLFHLVVGVYILRAADAVHLLHKKQALIVACLVSIGFSWLSFRFFESPIMAWGRRRVGKYRETDIILAQEQRAAV